MRVVLLMTCLLSACDETKVVDPPDAGAADVSVIRLQPAPGNGDADTDGGPDAGSDGGLDAG